MTFASVLISSSRDLKIDSYTLTSYMQNDHIPLFQLYWLYQRVLPSGFTRKGPSSVIAPAPKEEHPGPAVQRLAWECVTVPHGSWHTNLHLAITREVLQKSPPILQNNRTELCQHQDQQSHTLNTEKSSLLVAPANLKSRQLPSVPPEVRHRQFHHRTMFPTLDQDRCEVEEAFPPRMKRRVLEHAQGYHGVFTGV